MPVGKYIYADVDADGVPLGVPSRARLSSKVLAKKRRSAAESDWVVRITSTNLGDIALIVLTDVIGIGYPASTLVETK